MMLKTWTIIGVVIAGLSLAAYLWVTFFNASEPITTFAPQIMKDSPGSIQVLGNNNVIDSKAELFLDYKLEQSDIQASKYTFSLTYYSEDAINQGELPLKINKALKCQEPIRGREADNVGGKYNGMHTIQYSIACTSTQPIFSAETDNTLFRIQ